MTDIVLYSKVSSLKDRLEMGNEFTKKQIIEAIRLINQVNTILDRRRDSK